MGKGKMVGKYEMTNDEWKTFVADSKGMTTKKEHHALISKIKTGDKYDFHNMYSLQICIERNFMSNGTWLNIKRQFFTRK